MKYVYYPGCSLEGSAKEYDMATRAVLDALGVELEEIDWNCCGATAASSVDHLLSQVLPARNLALAEEKCADILAPCSECYMKSWSISDAMKDSPKVMDKVNEALKEGGLEYHGSIDVKHIVEVLFKDLGIPQLKEAVTTPLTGLKTVAYYGCLIVRPPRKNAYDSHENPTAMDEIIKAAGADVVDWNSKVHCCGGPVMLPNEELFMKMTRDILQDAKDAGADCIVTACPLCHLALDAKQKAISKAYQETYGIPVLYLTQLVGLGLGIDKKDLGLDKNLMSTENLPIQK